MGLLATAGLITAGAGVGSTALAGLATATDTALDSSNPLSLILNGGVLGAVLVLFLTGKLTTGREVEAVARERDKAQQELTALRSQMDERTLPALIRVTDLVARLEEDERRRRSEGS